MKGDKRITRFRVGIIGARGYTGSELVRWLARHPAVILTLLTTRQGPETPYARLYPEFAGLCDLPLTVFDESDVMQKCDGVFIALPHGQSMGLVPALLEAGKKVIDLGADFRFTDARVYEHWYKSTHTAASFLTEAAYGIPEFFPEKIRRSRLVANPGCYPVSILLALGPLIKEGLIEPTGIVADSKSGYSGAGRVEATTQKAQADGENFKAYKVSGHPHQPEAVTWLNALTHREVELTFVPHLLPVERGILSTIYARRRPGISPEKLYGCWKRFYQKHPFVRVLGDGQMPELVSVARTNYCDLGLWADPDGDRAVLISAIDNLGKGASGTAVQNMNLMLGLDERTGFGGEPL